MGEALSQIGSGGDGRKHPGQIGAQLAQELDLEELQPAPLMSTANAVRSQAAKVNRPDRSVMASDAYSPRFSQPAHRLAP